MPPPPPNRSATTWPGTQPVLLLDGDEPVGAKQNRVLNLTILAPPMAEIRIPVVCIEQAR